MGVCTDRDLRRLESRRTRGTPDAFRLRESCYCGCRHVRDGRCFAARRGDRAMRRRRGTVGGSTDLLDDAHGPPRRNSGGLQRCDGEHDRQPRQLRLAKREGEGRHELRIQRGWSDSTQTRPQLLEADIQPFPRRQ